jgi:hypothetical protein
MRDLGRPFGDLAEHMAVIDLLERVAPHVSDRYLPDEENEGDTILLCRMHRYGAIGRAWTPADHRHAWSAGKPCICQCHEPGTAFMAAHDGIDVVAPEQRIEKAQIALSRHTEDPIDPVRCQCIDNDLANGRHDQTPMLRSFRISSVV